MVDRAGYHRKYGPQTNKVSRKCIPTFDHISHKIQGKRIAACKLIKYHSFGPSKFCVYHFVQVLNGWLAILLVIAWQMRNDLTENNRSFVYVYYFGRMGTGFVHLARVPRSNSARDGRGSSHLVPDLC